MISIKSELPLIRLTHQLSVILFLLELIPSSSRSSSSSASPLPPQLAPLLSESLDKIKTVVAKVLPVEKKRSALEEAEWEDEGEAGALEREMMLQCETVSQAVRNQLLIYRS
jgi:ATPase family AAA domain-containing protein 2